MSHFRPASSLYQIKFKSYLLQNLAYLHDEIQNAVPIPVEEVRTQAMHTLSYALKVREAWSPTRDLLFILAPPMEQAGHREDWIPYLLQALQASIATGDQRAAAEIHLQLALLYRLLSQFKTAHEHVTASIDQFAMIDEPRNQARALNELAWLEQLRHHYEDARRYVDQALALLMDDDPERAMSYRVQGMIAIGYERWKEAENLHAQALALFEQRGDLRKMAWSIQNLAIAQYGQKQFREAISNYHKAATLLKQASDYYHWSVTQVNLGLAHYSLGEPETAIAFYQEAKLVAQRLHDTLQLGRIYTNLGLAYYALQTYTMAEESFTNSIYFYESIGDKSRVLNATDGLAMNYLAQRNYSAATTVLTGAIALLPQIADEPTYAYLFHSLQTHLQEALAGQASLAS